MLIFHDICYTTLAVRDLKATHPIYPIRQIQAHWIVPKFGNDTCKILTLNVNVMLFHRGVGAEPLLPWNRMLQTQNAAFQPNQYQMLAGPGGYPPRRDDRGGRQVMDVVWALGWKAYFVLTIRLETQWLVGCFKTSLCKYC